MNNPILTTMLNLLFFWFVIMLSIVVHELGHLLVALWCKVPIEGFSLGMGNPIIWKKKWKGIRWQITPWLIGGWTALEGESDNKNRKGFLAQRWSKKVAILVAGVAMNFLLACICYLVAYRSILTGIKIDLSLIAAFFTKDFTSFFNLLSTVKFHPFLMQISFINLFCCFNLLPLYPLDGGIMVWEPIIERYFDKHRELLQKIGMISIWILQVAIVGYIWFKK